MPIYVINTSGVAAGCSNRSPVVALHTDAASPEGLPAQVRSAADTVAVANLNPLRNGKLADGIDGALVWFEGDQLFQGDAAGLRKNLRILGRRTFVPVHYPYLDQMDLIAWQPRTFARGKPQEYWGLNLRVRNQGAASERVLSALRGVAQPWAQLSLSLLREVAQPGAGVEGLEILWQDAAKLPSAMAALVLRNLVLTLVRCQDFARAGHLLEQGMKLYEGYAELPYLAALLCIRDGRPAQSLPYVEKMRNSSRAFVGSGGENSFRLSWLLGLQALRSGHDRLAFRHLLASLGANPSFEPAQEIFKLRVPSEILEKCQWNFCQVARHEPRLLDRTIDYLLLHRCFDAARRLVETGPVSDEARATLQERLDRALMPFKPGARSSPGKCGITLEGPFLEHSSLARINREIGLSLLRDADRDTVLEPSLYASVPPEKLQGGDLIRQAMDRRLDRLDLTIRHRWPPDFRRPARGKLVVILPWEYGAVPRVWVHQINQNVDELWVPSRFVRDVLGRCGVRSELIQVIPNGIDPSLFTPKGAIQRPHAVRRFMFLFVGGAIRRKGVDLLLEAYGEAFEPGEDVSLLVTALGSQAAYLHNSLLEQVMSYAWDPAAPHLELLTGELDDATLANLYRGCDAFVLPYRAEGFCMPVLEAMACGKPVITTALGPSQEFCSPSTAYLVPARECQVPEEPPAFGPLAGEFTWFEPDVRELARTLRRVYENREEAARRGAAAAQKVREAFGWPAVTRLYRERIAVLIADPVPSEPQLQAASSCG